MPSLNAFAANSNSPLVIIELLVIVSLFLCLHSLFILLISVTEGFVLKSVSSCSVSPLLDYNGCFHMLLLFHNTPEKTKTAEAPSIVGTATEPTYRSAATF